MQTLKPQLKKPVLAVAVLGLAAFLGYLLLFSDLSSVVGVIAKTSVPIYALAFLCVFVGAVFNTLTWESTLSSLGVNFSFRRLFGLMWAGYFVDAMVPGPWTGDIFKAYLLSKDPGAKGAKIAASIVVQNILDVIITLVALTSGMVLLALNYALAGEVVFIGGLIMFFMAAPSLLIIVFSSNPAVAKRIYKWAQRQWARLRRQPIVEDSAAESKIEASLRDFHDGIMLIKTNPRAVVRPLIFQSLAWTLDICTLFLIFASLGYVVGPDKLIITNTVVVNLQSQGIALVGFAQVAASTIYTALGISQFVSAASSILAGFATFWFKLAVSFVAFQVVVFERYVPLVNSKGNGGFGKARKSPDVKVPLLKNEN